MSIQQNWTRGLNFLGLLTIVLIVLKVLGVDISWLWVLCPIWIIPGFVLGGLVAGIMGFLIFMLMLCVFD